MGIDIQQTRDSDIESLMNQLRFFSVRAVSAGASASESRRSESSSSVSRSSESPPVSCSSSESCGSNAPPSESSLSSVLSTAVRNESRPSESRRSESGNGIRPPRTMDFFPRNRSSDTEPPLTPCGGVWGTAASAAAMQTTAASRAVSSERRMPGRNFMRYLSAKRVRNFSMSASPAKSMTIFPPPFFDRLMLISCEKKRSSCSTSRR